MTSPRILPLAALVLACEGRGTPSLPSEAVSPSPCSVPASADPSHDLEADEPPIAGESCRLRDQPGFNHYTVAAINDTARWPRNGTNRYCWGDRREPCKSHWGAIHDANYAGETVIEGGGDCYCSGLTLELFLHAYGLWQKAHGVPKNALYEVGGYDLRPGDLQPLSRTGHVFYQLWQGAGFAHEASQAAAFEAFGIGRSLPKAQWDSALPGDYVNFTRRRGSGHAVVFVRWIVNKGRRVGLRYFSCNSHGDSCPDPKDPKNASGIPGPSFNTEYFLNDGGWILPDRIIIGRPFLPTTPH